MAENSITNTKSTPPVNTIDPLLFPPPDALPGPASRLYGTQTAQATELTANVSCPCRSGSRHKAQSD